MDAGTLIGSMYRMDPSFNPTASVYDRFNVGTRGPMSACSGAICRSRGVEYERAPMPGVDRCGRSGGRTGPFAYSLPECNEGCESDEAELARE